MFNPGALEAPFQVLRAVPRDQRPEFSIDAASQLAEVDARLSLGAVESLLSSAGLTLGLDTTAAWSTSVADWVAHGFPGAKDAWADPVAARVAGFEATAGGVQARVRPAPRRATGPDLLALFAGTRGEIGEVERITLAVAARHAPTARAQPFSWNRDPLPSAEEIGAFDLIKRALRPA